MIKIPDADKSTMASFLEVCGVFYLASLFTMAGAAAVDSARAWFVQRLREHDYHTLAMAHGKMSRRYAF